LIVNSIDGKKLHVVPFTSTALRTPRSSYSKSNPGSSPIFESRTFAD